MKLSDLPANAPTKEGTRISDLMSGVLESFSASSPVGNLSPEQQREYIDRRKELGARLVQTPVADIGGLPGDVMKLSAWLGASSRVVTSPLTGMAVPVATEAGPEYEQEVDEMLAGIPGTSDKIYEALTGEDPASAERIILSVLNPLNPEGKAIAGAKLIASLKSSMFAAKGGTSLIPFVLGAIKKPKRVPELVDPREARVQALEDFKAGRISKEQFDAADQAYVAAIDKYKSFSAYEELPELSTLDEMENALNVDQALKVRTPIEKLERGSRTSLRLDIPAFTRHGKWVVTVHKGKGGKTVGNVIGYDNHGSLTNATMNVGDEKIVLGIARGKPKNPGMRIEGEWQPMTEDEALRRAEAAMADPAWTQVGFEPERHSFFWDRATGQQVVAADEVIQVGGLVLAKNPRYGEKTGHLFETVGAATVLGVTGATVSSDAEAANNKSK